MIQENLTGIRVVRAFARQDFERKKFAVPNLRYRDASLRMLRHMSWYWSISDFVALGQLGLTLLVGAHWITTGAVSVGNVFTFLSYLALMLWPVRQMGRILTDLGKTAVAIVRIREIESIPIEPEPPLTPWLTEQPLLGRITVRNLRFGHGEDRHALNGITFDVRVGETLAILARPARERARSCICFCGSTITPKARFSLMVGNSRPCRGMDPRANRSRDARAVSFFEVAARQPPARPRRCAGTMKLKKRRAPRVSTIPFSVLSKATEP